MLSSTQPHALAVISGTHPRAPSSDKINAINKRYGGICCVTGKQGSLWDPVIVAPILPVPSAWPKREPRIIQLLEASFGPQYFDWWRFFIHRAETYSSYQTHWLIRKSVHKALQRGIVRLIRLPSSIVEFGAKHVLIGDEQLIDVQRLPFGLYLKYDSNLDTLRNEYNALRVLKQKTTIPAPRAFDVVSQNTGEEDFSYLLMSRVPGTALGTCWDALSDQDYANLSAQLKDCVSQMRDIPKPANHGICNTLGEACRDPRIRDWAPIRPFPDEASFS
ncbi:hypothetical protein FOIG_11583 [Fusarium odoratissimum NRRL 54006]|uniref:Aminoglycoside phosphotransferase domain-containing protein n=1 Tax=Fusarium odoratissimum (strain NRRL 54006) TaxID=1089451 RepID=X0J4C7_FUSO5|nr:uncharacterized protein FOIG_11583 [Fusarium odoratissimum NRRL 54006]EXL96043.1 hypothetical protein FOIG_11583 [Fusarium odoratissimum NRRL 54006]